MIHSKTIVAAAVFFMILFSSAGCYRPSLDAILNRPKGEDEQTMQADAGNSSSLHNVQVTQSNELLLAPSDVVHHLSYQEPFAVRTSESEMPNQTFTLPYMIRQAFAHNMQVWLLDYEVGSASPVSEPESLTALLSYPRKSWELASTPTPANQIRAFIALPEGWTPLFNVRITSPTGEHRLALDGRDDLFPRPQGRIQIYAVHPDGSHHPTPPLLACHDTHASEDQPAGFVPSGACPEIVDSCPVLYELTCHHL